MITKEQFNNLLPLACSWVEQQEQKILAEGEPLNEDLQIDAWMAGVKNVTAVRLMKVPQIPVPDIPELKEAIKQVGLLTPQTIGITFRYGIYIRADFWGQRQLIAHELTHTMQYERLGGIEPFLKRYLTECLTEGYPFGALEREAEIVSGKICRV